MSAATSESQCQEICGYKGKTIIRCNVVASELRFATERGAANTPLSLTTCPAEGSYMAGLHDKPRLEREQDRPSTSKGETWIPLGTAVAGALRRQETPGEAATRLMAMMDRRGAPA